MPKTKPTNPLDKDFVLEETIPVEDRPLAPERELSDGILHVSLWFGTDQQYHISGPMASNSGGVTTILEAVVRALGEHISNEAMDEAEENDRA